MHKQTKKNHKISFNYSKHCCVSSADFEGREDKNLDL